MKEILTFANNKEAKRFRPIILAIYFFFCFDKGFMKILIILFFAIYLPTTKAEDFFNNKVQVEKKGDNIFLKGSDCNVLDKEAKALAEWTKKVKENPNAPEKCTCAGSVCTKRVTAILPKIVNSTQFVTPQISGPNCWNASLVASKIIPQLRYSTEQEMDFWVNSPLCKQKKSSDSLAPGDVIAIIHKTQGQYHGFINISENLSFSKNGFDSDNPYTLQDPKNVFETYDVKPECVRTDSPGSCVTYAKYYSCMTMEEYRKSRGSQDKELRDTIQAMNSLECSLTKSLFTLSPSDTVDNLIVMNVEVLNELISTTFLDKKFKPEDAVLWEGLYYQIGAITQQIQLKNTVGM